MIVVPGTNVQVTFNSFTSTPTHPYPDIYFAAGEGSVNMASVNAGNADGLCVGLSGVNGQFYSDLSAAGQKCVNLGKCLANPTGNLDDYQDRHWKLMAQAQSNPASQTYSQTDPCSFALSSPSPITNPANWYQGVCFADIFDPSLCPNGNSKNVAMLYIGPPYDDNFVARAASRAAATADFLAAIEATAVNIIRTIAAYNAIAAQNKLPLIESLRSTLYSSGIYNRKLAVPPETIARAIFDGYRSELNKQSGSGLAELQFPVKNGDPNGYFAAVQSDLIPPSPGIAPGVVGNPNQAAKRAKAALVRAGKGINPGPKLDPTLENHDDDGEPAVDGEEGTELAEIHSETDSLEDHHIDAVHYGSVADAIKTSAAAVIKQLTHKIQPTPPAGYTVSDRPANQLKPASEYGAAPLPEDTQAQSSATQSQNPPDVSAAESSTAAAPNQQYGPAPNLAAQGARAGYTAPAVERRNYLMLQPNDSAGSKLAKEAGQEAESALEAALQYQTLRLQPVSRAQLETHVNAAKTARENAGKAVIQIRNGTASPEELRFALEMAETAETLASTLESNFAQYVVEGDFIVAPAGRARSNTGGKVAGILTGLGLTISAGILTWALGFSNGRRSLSFGVAKFQVANIGQIAPNYTFDIINFNALNTSYLTAVTVTTTNSSNPLADPNNYGTWSVDPSTFVVTFTPTGSPAGVVASASYYLVAHGYPGQDPSGNTLIDSLSAALTLTFPGKDIVVAAKDRTNPVNIPVSANSTITGPATDSNGGSWSIAANTAGTIATYTPGGVGTVSSVSVAYLDGNTGTAANLVIVFPAIPVAVAFSAPPYHCQLLPNAVLPGSTTDPATLKQTVSNDTGTWTLDPAANRAAFAPSSKTPLPQTVSTPYLFQVESVPSITPAEITFLFNPAPVTIAASSRTNLVGVKIPNAGLSPTAAPGQITLPDPTGNGTWSYDPAQPGVISFIPPVSPTQFGVPDSVQYVSIPYFLVIGEVPSVNSGTLTVVLPTANLNFVAGSRTAASSFSLANTILGSSPATPPAATQTIQDQAGNTWSYAAGSLTFTPESGGIPPALASASIPYSVVVNGVPSSSAGALTVTFPAPLSTPATVAVTGAQRNAQIDLDIPANNATITGSYQVLLLQTTGTGNNAVMHLVTSAVDSFGTWSVQTDNARPLYNHVFFTPSVAAPVVQSTQPITFQYVLAFNNGISQAGSLSITFSTNPIATAFIQSFDDFTKPVILNFPMYSATPNGFNGITLQTMGLSSSSQLVVPNQGTWTVETPPSPGLPDVKFVPSASVAPGSSTSYTITYLITDNNGQQSSAQMTAQYVPIAVPTPTHARAADLMVAAVPPLPPTIGGKVGGSAAFDPLPQCSSRYLKDHSSVRILGLATVGQETSNSSAVLKDDGKAMAVPDEGVWLVTDDGKIVFQAEPNLTVPPTAITYQFSDIYGNESTPGVIVMDPDLAKMQDVLDALSLKNSSGDGLDLDDAAFWTQCRKTLKSCSPPDDDREFLIATSILSRTIEVAMYRLGIPNGPGPQLVPHRACSKAYQDWVSAKFSLSDTATTPGLFTICQTLAETYYPGDQPLLMLRYWSLVMMQRIVARTITLS